MDSYSIHCTRRACICVLSLLIVLDCYFHVYVYYNVLRTNDNRNVYDVYATMELQNDTIAYYKYPMVNSEQISMNFNNQYNSSYYWFMSMKHLFKNIGEEAQYSEDTPKCQLNTTSNTTLGPISINKTEPQLEWIEKQNPDVKPGGYYAPAHCRATHRVAVVIAYRDQKESLSILLRYLHPLLQKQLQEYRIFVIEQYGTEKLNKGTLYNIAFLETQRFGTWHCLIFHDVDLIPEDERISYSCPENPTHMSSAIDVFGYDLPYINNYGGVTAFNCNQYEDVNGYSNLYWNGGSMIDDDMYQRLLERNIAISRYNMTIARYASLTHPKIERRRRRLPRNYREIDEGLRTTKYDIVSVTIEKLYTNILADVNPTKMKHEPKNLMQKFLFN